MYEAMIEYVRKYFENHDPLATDLPVKFPFRNRFDHILRVYHWALRINRMEKGDEEVVAVAAIFHDIGKAADDDRPHAIVSAEICEAYLRSDGFSEEKRSRIVETIRMHSSKTMDKSKLTLEQRILMDADMLDEVGATAVLWDSMAVALEENPSYLRAHQRHCEFYAKLKGYKKLLKTGTGKKLYTSRLKVLRNFIKETEYELGLT